MSAQALRDDEGELEHRYLSSVFADLCRIESPSGRERGCAQRVAEELRAIGLEVEEDRAAERLGCDSGNLLARIPSAQTSAGSAEAPGAPCVLLCAHLDTVPLQAAVEPQLSEGVWRNANHGILGADNKAAVAVLLALARRVRRAGAPLEIELLFTVGEEVALAGARAFDVARLRSRVGYVFDHASAIGEVIVASPSHFRIDATFRGRSAHAGIRPERGRSAIVAAARAIAAMSLGRVDDDSTANLGCISGGSAMNVVAEECSLVAEARSMRDERAEQLATEMVARVHEAANVPECECDVDVSVQRTFAGYRLPASRPVVRAAERALISCGHQPRHVVSGGASDANVFNARGLEVVNLANGTEANHEPGERVSDEALGQMLTVARALLDELAGDGAAATR